MKQKIWTPLLLIGMLLGLIGMAAAISASTWKPSPTGAESVAPTAELEQIEAPTQSVVTQAPTATVGSEEASSKGYVLLDQSEALLTLVNAARCESDLNPLVLNPLLDEAALVHSVDMWERDFFDHLNPDGDGPDARISATGYTWSRVGENIAAGYPTAEAVFISWMESEGHRENIMNPAFREMGVGLIEAADSAYGSYWTQTFGRAL
ncbi:MAG: CAP domain-containing protein, partial [Chloroflexi bacterium]|nr:CAP domain-containing protein [Chloroflexota bacterium]